MNILVYYPSNQRTISIESVTLKFKEQGHKLYLLTQCEEGDLHNELKNHGIITNTKAIRKSFSLIYYFKHLIHLVRFCRNNQIDITYSHLQQANIISVFAQYFCSTNFIICRHHSSISEAERNFYQSLFDKVIGRLARQIVVPSKMVYKQVCTYEGVNPENVKLIHYGYDFNKYPKPNLSQVEKIRTNYKAKLLLVKVARLVHGKRYDILFEVVRRLVIEENKDVKVLVISDGPLMSELALYIKNNNLENNIFLLGNVDNVIDYLAAADVVPLMSEAEASNSVIKEAGLVGKTVVVCRNVGDFEDYIENQVSGYLISKDNPHIELFNVLNLLYNNNPAAIGDNLRKSVLNNFSIEKVITKYDKINKA